MDPLKDVQAAAEMYEFEGSGIEGREASEDEGWN